VSRRIVVRTSDGEFWAVLALAAAGLLFLLAFALSGCGPCGAGEPADGGAADACSPRCRAVTDLDSGVTATVCEGKREGIVCPVTVVPIDGPVGRIDLLCLDCAKAPEPKEVPGPVAPGGGGAAEPLYQWVPRPDLDAAHARVAELKAMVLADAVSSTVSQDYLARLRAEARAEAIEECAKVAEGLRWSATCEEPNRVARAIRALAAPPSPTKEPTDG
jgi:hypothetical protein